VIGEEIKSTVGRRFELMKQRKASLEHV